MPLGSVMGLTLWNVMYDEEMCLSLPKGAKIIGFADDIRSIVVTAKSVEDFFGICNHAIRTVRSWLHSTGLQLADHKTETVLIIRRKAKETITLTAGDQKTNLQRGF